MRGKPRIEAIDCIAQENLRGQEENRISRSPILFLPTVGRHARVEVKSLPMDGLLTSMIGCTEIRKVGTVKVNAHEDCDSDQRLDS